MSSNFHFDIKRDGGDFPAFIEGKRVEINEQGRHFVTIGGRRWVLDPNEPPLETLSDPEQFQSFPPPPRQVTLLGKLTLLLGGGIPGMLYIGCIFACGGMALVCLITAASAIDVFARWQDNGEASITAIEETVASVNDNKTYAFSFSGHDADGNEISGISYALKSKFQFKEGQTVPLQRTSFFGEKWKLKGANFTCNAGDKIALWIPVPFPLLGLAAVFFGGILWGLKRSTLVKYGELALASYLRQESVPVHVNGRTVMKLIFQFETYGELYEATLKTLDPEKYLGDDRRKIVFYNPDNPKKNMIWDSVASMMKFDEFQQRFTGFTVNVIAFPVFFAIFCFEIVWFCHNVMTGKMFF